MTNSDGNETITMIMMTMMTMTMITMTIIMMKVDNNDADLTFSHDKETKKQDHGVARKDKVAAIFLKNILLNLSLNALY